MNPELLPGHVLDRLAELPAGHFHCAVTSPPYWGLRDYKLPPQTWPDDWSGSLGLEPSIDLYLSHLLAVMEAVRRVLRDDATCWINIGDCFAHDRAYQVRDNKHVEVGNNLPMVVDDGLKPGDQCSIPERFKLAMIAAGWWCRQTIVWAKGVSFCKSYSGSVMPESVSGTRWERCRVKVATAVQTFDHAGSAQIRGGRRLPDASGGVVNANDAKFVPCPGCPRCAPNDGWVLRRGSGRATNAFEYLYQFAKGPRYYYDTEAVRERGSGIPGGNSFGATAQGGPHARRCTREDRERQAVSRNLRNVWAIGTQAYRGKHFATYPIKLAEACIKAGTSERGCCSACGAPWARMVESEYIKNRPSAGNDPRSRGEDAFSQANGTSGFRGNNLLLQSRTLGWRLTCQCGGEPVPCRVLDPFTGTGTTLIAAMRLGRDGTGIELSEPYMAQARKRLERHRHLWA